MTQQNNQQGTSAWTLHKQPVDLVVDHGYSLRKALEWINERCSGDRATVHELNAFEHFKKLNTLLVEVRTRARAALDHTPQDDADVIEAVALAIEGTMFAPHELPATPDLHEKYRATASAAIAAYRAAMSSGKRGDVA
jgi:hypothetical protein